MLVTKFPSAIAKIEVNKDTILTEEVLQSLKWFCLNDGTITDLSKKQLKQLAAYMVKEAEQYSSGHSMRYSIIKAYLKATGLI